MKNSNEQRSQGINILLAVNLAITVGAGITALVMHQSARSMEQDTIASARSNFDLMKGYRDKLYDVWKKVPRSSLHELPKNPTDLFAFIEECLKSQNIDKSLLQQLTPIPPKKEGDEYALHIQLQEKQGRKIKRDQIVRFLVDIEKGRAFLRTRNLQVNFSDQDPNDVTTAIITLAYSVPKSDSKSQ